MYVYTCISLPYLKREAVLGQETQQLGFVLMLLTKCCVGLVSIACIGGAKPAFPKNQDKIRGPSIDPK